MSGIVVLGQGRTGTSAVAGVLHHLGVYMGEGLLFSTPDNLRGSFEDARFVEIHDKMLGNWRCPKLDAKPHLGHYRHLVAQMESHDPWGLKDPRLCFTFPVLLSVLKDDIKVIFTERPLMAVVESLAAMTLVPTRSMACDIADRYCVAAECARRMVAQYPMMTINYDALIDDPLFHVTAMARFANLAVTQAALDFVDPRLRHWVNV